MSKPRILLVLAAIIGLIASALLLLMPRHAYAECNGCQQTVDPTILVCTSSCNSEGYRISVIKKINGGPSIPPECSLHGVSASMQYIVLEKIPQVRTYSMTEWPGISQNPNFTFSQVTSHTVGPNDMVCDWHGDAIYNGNYVTATLSLTQGTVACYPAREDTIDCGDYNTMAVRYDGHAHTPVPNQLKPCGDGCNEIIQGGSGGDSTRLPHGGLDAEFENPEAAAELHGHPGTGKPVTHTTGVKIPVLPHATPTTTTTTDTARQDCLRKGGTASMTTGKLVCILPQPKTLAHPGTPDTKGAATPQGTPGKR